jgi:hypothetical protein
MEISIMLNSFIKAGAVLAFASVAFASQASAISPLPAPLVPTLVTPAGDDENEAVWGDLRPDVTPPRAAVGSEGEASGGAMERPKEEGSGGNVENEEVWHNLRPDVTPPPAATGQ